MFTILIIDNQKISSRIKKVYDAIDLQCKFVECRRDFILNNKLELSNLNCVIIDSEDESFIIHLLEYFRGRWKYKYLPILLLSSSLLSSSIEKFIAFGVVDFLQKPVDDYFLTYSLLYAYNINKAFKTINSENLILKKKLIELERLRIANVDLAVSSQKLVTVNRLLEEKQEKIKEQQIELIKTKRKTEDLLLNIFPYEVSRELMISGQSKPQSYSKVTVMFTDFVGFTRVCENISPEEMTSELDKHFSHFDDICEMHFLEKIKTIGDAYMCAGGIPMRNNSNPFDIVLAALKIIKYMNEVNKEKRIQNLPEWQIRIGLHTGSIVAGVIGKKKFAYDIWGDAVNTASRIESTSETGRINISGVTYNEICDYFDCSYRGKIYAKNKGEIDMYFIDGIKPEYAKDKDLFEPNSELNKMIAKL